MSYLAFDRHFSPDLFQMPPPALPKLGQTRCCWTLLSAELKFLYVDPVLHAHLGPQADAIVGRRLLEFVHPDEHASAQQDLRKVLQSRTLHGSVTRVRYSRLARVRARLGFSGVHLAFPDEDKVSFDENYIACDLVINWAAEGLVLCFIHAVVDMSPQDNDEVHRTQWTNWCGTPRMSHEHGNDLYHALFHIAPHIAQGAPPPTRVFQILHNSTDRPTLFSWPAEGYIPADYGRLANDVQIGGANGSDAKTSCTRRYKAQQVLDSADGSVRDVESIYIPHGHIIFACHKATPRRPRGHPNSYALYPTPAQFYDAPTQHTYYPPVPVPSQAEPYPPQTYSPYAPTSHPQSPPPSSPASRDTGTQSPYQHQHQQTQTDWQQPYMDAPQQPQQQQQQQQSPLVDAVPPPRQRGGRGPTPPETSVTPSAGASTGVGGYTREAYPIGGRAGGNPPVGVSRCAACKSTSSPEWRKGPSGRKDLCNACGLRYSRARAKKEGTVVQRRRKDPSKQQQQQPPPPPPQQTQVQTQGLPESSARRRGYAGNEYAEYPLDEQHQPMGSGEGSTSSPSPPHDYAQAQHTPSGSTLYSYDPRHALYPYTTPPQHGNGFLAPTASPAPADTGGSSDTPVVSYERTGLPAAPRAGLERSTHPHVPS